MAHILLIDDSKSILALLHTILESQGHVVCEAGNGQEGLELYVERPTDLVITGIAMPDMSGLDVISQLRRVSPNVKVIPMSVEQGKLDAAKALGARQTLHKPFNLEQLLSAVRYELAH